jgi:hypothetical protein
VDAVEGVVEVIGQGVRAAPARSSSVCPASQALAGSCVQDLQLSDGIPGTAAPAIGLAAGISAITLLTFGLHG